MTQSGCVDPIQNNTLPDKYQINYIGWTRQSASTIFNISQWFKSMSTNKYIQNIKNNNWQPLNKRLWQRSFHDHIVCNDKSCLRQAGIK